MQLHTELFRLRQLLLEELEERGCLPFREVETVEVDLTGGELIVSLLGGGLELFPVFTGFCRRHGLEVSCWDTEEGVCHLTLEASLPGGSKPTPDPTEEEDLQGESRLQRLRREYAGAVRQVFAAPDHGPALLAAGRCAWALGRADYARHWFLRAGEMADTWEVRVEGLLWAGICLHLETQGGERHCLTRAFRCYRSVLDLDPDNYFALLNLGKLTMLMGRIRVSRTLFRRALLVNPEDNEAAALLGQLDGE